MEHVSRKAVERGLDDRDQTCHTQDQENGPQLKGRATKQCWALVSTGEGAGKEEGVK